MLQQESNEGTEVCEKVDNGSRSDEDDDDWDDVAAE